MNRLTVIADLLRPCPPPDLAGGYDMCPCGYGGSWPCSVTRAAWIARGLNPETEIDKVITQVRAECEVPDWDPGDWDPDLRTCWTSAE
jgi:hypothetical protein